MALDFYADSLLDMKKAVDKASDSYYLESNWLIKDEGAAGSIVWQEVEEAPLIIGVYGSGVSNVSD